MIPSYYFSMLEIKLDMIFACDPALRQFLTYRKRTKSFLSTKHRQHPNENFEKMRYRINIRDIFWYRKAFMIENRVIDVARIFQSKTSSSNAFGDDSNIFFKVSSSILDVWENRIKNVVGGGRSHKVSINLWGQFARGYLSADTWTRTRMLLGLATPGQWLLKCLETLLAVQNRTLRTRLQRKPPQGAGGACLNASQRPARAVRKHPFFYRTARLAQVLPWRRMTNPSFPSMVQISTTKREVRENRQFIGSEARIGLFCEHDM